MNCLLFFSLWVVPAPDENLVSVFTFSHLRTSLLIMRTRSFFTLLYVVVHAYEEEEESSALQLYFCLLV